jgi:catechol 2,3-dioxygenase-like lactoylglutathione lyase family enzyme
MSRFSAAVVLALFLFVPRSASAQLLAAKDGPVVYGHHHLSAANVDAAKKFWTETMGGTLAKVGTGTTEVVKIPNALIFFAARPATGGSKGTTFDHLGLSVPNLRAVLDKVKAAGFKVITVTEAPPNVKVVDDIGVVDAGGVTGIGYVLGPDDVKIELVEMKAQQTPLANHHLHFFGEKQAEMQAWYVKTFGAETRPAPNPTMMSAGLPGLGMNFSQAAGPVVGTRGRAVDHIGFEVKNLEAFMKNLEAQGIKIDRPYTKVDALGIAIGFITDPWGTYIELTEGLDKVQ